MHTIGGDKITLFKTT